ncbi:UbiA family prenyltransferase [Ferruginibacter paludis]|uniref:UbiA family prenyltransferase n=1 Tax=Ferruginibacter paludis TaxID=1310417 RepID=UPI0025B56783|nr:UbiA family prenyltransferase [Ferruginibacter paludis]MDN3654892.1 UbiA family prenyltransferase [Ferruginibacter paludis]
MLLIKSSTIQLLRFHFSFFLMPVYWFALSQTPQINTGRAILIFVILHLLVYPASNGYNSYMDRDTESVGGIKNPMQPTPQLFYVTVLLDAIAIALSCFISIYFVIGILAYILASRAYSYRGIRLKKYPIAGYVTVIFFQGAVTFFLVMHGGSNDKTLAVPLFGMIAASLLIGGFYPLTQIYQHQQDKADGVNTLSLLLGYKGTFIFTAIVYFVAVSTLAYQLLSTLQKNSFFIIQIFFIPVLVYFFWWFRQVTLKHTAANFVNTMRMTLLASVCTNAAFITLFLIEKL